MVCERPGCGETILEGGIHGYCDRHAVDAVVEAVDRVAGNLDDLAGLTARVHEDLEAVKGVVTDIYRELPGA